MEVHALIVIECLQARTCHMTCTVDFVQVDVVYVGNLHVQHLQTVLMLFEAGKPVLCEKPLTTSARKAATMIQAAKEKNLFMMEVIHKPPVVSIRKSIVN